MRHYALRNFFSILHLIMLSIERCDELAHLFAIRYNKKACTRFLFFSFWIIGIIAGYCFASQIDIIHFSLMRSVLSSRVSIVSLLLVHSVPFLLVILIDGFLHKAFISIMLFIRAFLFSSISFLILFSFSEAGWLVRNLLFFTDSIISFYFLLFSVQIADTGKPYILNSFVLIFSCCLIDYYVISPFISALYI